MEDKPSLHDCVISRNMALMMTMLDNGAYINVRDKGGRTPLQVAARELYQEVIEVLLERGAEVNLQDEIRHNTPLHEGVGSVEVVKALVDKGASPECKNLHDETPLHLAVQEGNVPVVELLLSVGADINVKDKEGNSPLTEAVCNCSHEIIKILVDKGADVKSQTREGTTPLHIAVRMNEFSTVQLLLNAGADPNMTDEALVSDQKKGYTALHYAAENGNHKVVQLLLDSGADPNIRDGYDETPLHWIINKGSPEMIRLILEKGADVNVKNLRGFTPLHFAVRDEKLEIVELLLISGAVVNVKNYEGVTPLHESVYNFSYKIMKLLIEHGAEVDSKNKKGDTPLHDAVVRCRDDHVAALLDLGASEDIVNNDGKTPLNAHSSDKTVCFLFKMHLDKLKSISLLKKKEISWKDLEPFQVSCLEELKSMEEIKHGNHSLFDVLSKNNDPYYVNNSLIEKEIIVSDKKFPIYHLLLHVTFQRAKQRYEMLNEAQEYFNVDILPMEMKRKILSFFTDEDLRNVIKAVKKGT